MTAAAALMLAATLSTNPADVPPPAASAQGTMGPIAAAVAAVPALETPTERWMTDYKPTRPGALTAMYGTLGALQVLDIYSTRRALNAGASEANPVMRKAAGSQAAMMAAKAISTAGAVYFSERAWKKNRKGAVVLMAVMNGVTAGIVAHNLRNAR